ncbi:oxidoreductase [Gluconacetobacter liquefaciens]|uniref:3-oxoacyl-[acyl-carrier protein] reductase n=1 Tax=Gluconacetobacter liquefaciens TaxID=89584 RepID=A0A370GAL5_GLULI|nr:SDR family oxidoreductase [Gluconacetobacter liquefaciens]MBB2185409.1 SDR family oxidoreductase [Gluconacetobacter liquefaciens]RDI40855.1 3-oxoacyl-[acyl-carrier protein] reductase [Gluconacetobacter liquefaciens]GBQ92134.1 dehydrogenase [Gluconacetobacter liquefaciens NRIC 0522]GEB39316.1 oxidoreductase [Gluconacetobacter liquefaciens]
MDLGLEGRQAIVCGASRGMGRAIALTLATEGASVTLVARDPKTLEETASLVRAQTGREATPVAADLTRDDDRRRVFDSCPAPDILVNNGGGMPPGDFRDWDRAHWIAGVDMMMLAPIEMIRLTVDGMSERGFGRIVNIVSRSVKNPQAEMALSNAARSGLVAFSSGLARQVIARNVTINNVLPGIIDSAAQHAHVRDLSHLTGRSYDSIWAERAAGNPAKRFGDVDEIAATVAFFCSHKAGFITAQSLLVDGGDYRGLF